MNYKTSNKIASFDLEIFKIYFVIFYPNQEHDYFFHQDSKTYLTQETIINYCKDNLCCGIIFVDIC